MNILHEQLKGLPGGLRPKMEIKVTSHIMSMVNALNDSRLSMEQVNLTLLKEVANIKAVIDLARNLQQPQVSKNQQDPDDESDTSL